ncbi:hypothetical protein EMCRGX_G006890 [Ephydatia muelleri]
MNLAVLDWNENVQRAATSHRFYLNSRRPDHCAPSHVLVSKTFKFVQNIWDAFLDMNRQSILPVLDGDEEDAIDGESLFMPGVEPEDGDFIDGDEDDDELYDEALDEGMDGV